MNNKFITPIGPENWNKIRLEAMRLGSNLNARTCMSGKCGNRHAVAGPAGEIAVAAFFPQFKRIYGCPDYDFIAPNGARIEVKTRSGATLPRDEFDVRVPCYSFTQQECDIYVFAFAKWHASGVALDAVSLVGWLPKSEFASVAEVREVASASAQNSGFNQREGGEDLMFTQIYRLRDMGELANFVVDKPVNPATVCT